MTAFKRGLSNRPICKLIKLSKTVTDNFINQANAYGYNEEGCTHRKMISR